MLALCKNRELDGKKSRNLTTGFGPWPIQSEMKPALTLSPDAFHLPLTLFTPCTPKQPLFFSQFHCLNRLLFSPRGPAQPPPHPPPPLFFFPLILT